MQLEKTTITKRICDIAHFKGDIMAKDSDTAVLKKQLTKLYKPVEVAKEDFDAYCTCQTCPLLKEKKKTKQAIAGTLWIIPRDKGNDDSFKEYFCDLRCLFAHMNFLTTRMWQDKCKGAGVTGKQAKRRQSQKQIDECFGASQAETIEDDDEDEK